MARLERIGVFGGTFDPVHIGHLVAANEVRHALELDRVLMVVAPRPWQKGDRRLTPVADRLAMVAAAVEDVDGLEASVLEVDRAGPTYTVDTLRALAGPERELFLIVGADVAAVLDTWEQPEEVANLATLVIVNRPGSPPAGAPPSFRVTHVDTPLLEVSSSDIRRRLAEGRPVDFLVPGPALAFLRQA